MNTLLPVFVCCLVLLTPFSASRADSLGRLFTTPQERASLDSKSGIKLANRNTAQSKASQHIKLNGTVTSSTGKRNFWVNGKKHSNKNPDEPRVHLTKSRQIQIDTPYRSKSAIIKPGQVLNLGNGQVYEAFMIEKTQTEAAKDLEANQ